MSQNRRPTPLEELTALPTFRGKTLGRIKEGRRRKGEAEEEAKRGGRDEDLLQSIVVINVYKRFFIS